MRIPVQVKVYGQTVLSNALIDSGAEGKFIDSKFVAKHRIPVRKLVKPIPVHNVDGTPNQNGTITHYTLRPLLFGNKLTMAFLLRTTKTIKPLKDSIPAHYHNFIHLFEKKAAERFPIERPYDHAIDLKPDFVPRDCKLYSMTPKEELALDEFLTENLRKGYIRPSKSPMASPFFFIGKKDNTLRPCQDYRALNEGTIKNAYPLPLIGDLMDKLRGAKYFTKLDLRSGYNNIRIKEGDQYKAAFKTIRGLFEPTVMFFGLCNSPATFQMFMNDIFRIIITEEAILIYMDDILIFSDNLEDLRRKTNRVLKVLQDNDLFLKPEKCVFEVQEVEFLGMILRPDNIHMDPVKLAGIQQWPEPHTVKQLRSFLGFCNFYRRFIPNYSSIAYPLNELTRTNEPWKWNELRTNAFITLKNLFSSQPALLIPDKTKPFILETDASKVASGAVLYQANSNGDLQPCGFISEAFGPAQQRYEALPLPQSSGVTTRTYPTSEQPAASPLANPAGTSSYPNLTSPLPINPAKTSLVPTPYLDDPTMAQNQMKNELSSPTPYSLAELMLTYTTASKNPKPLINSPTPSFVLKPSISPPLSNSPLMTGPQTLTFSSFANAFTFPTIKTLNNKSFTFSMISLPSATQAYSKPLPLFVNTIGGLALLFL
ncbi:hypothetical protein EW145_g3606 [Phellinidium pouzarii]|uniref:Reverse transcriptase domain-containing protein n=1 Tax=Phellinidium pouzarii TaxID=167371 RepID=A0A4S4L6H3_9AGAM|nr:hypothetical protein EW145_g3606 [Phellinidium pouzarii]